MVRGVSLALLRDVRQQSQRDGDDQVQKAGEQEDIRFKGPPLYDLSLVHDFVSIQFLIVSRSY